MTNTRKSSTEARLERLDSILGPSSSESKKSTSANEKASKSKNKTTHSTTSAKDSKTKQKPKTNTAKVASHKQIRDQSYSTTMEHIEQNLNPAQRAISRVIRLPVIDELSLLLSKTILRPSMLIGAGTVATLGMLVLLYTAHTVGFRTSGSELFILLAIGWIAGGAIELMRTLVGKILK